MGSEGGSINIKGDHTTIVVCGHYAHAGEKPAQRSVEGSQRGRTLQAWAQAERARTRAQAERSWARSHPCLYLEGGTRAYEDSDERSSSILRLIAAGLLLAAILGALVNVGLPGGFLANSVTIGFVSVLVGAVVVVPAALVSAFLAGVIQGLVDWRAERGARERAEPRERAERLARETAENDRRLGELGIDL